MEFIENNKSYKFIPYPIKTISSFTIKENTFKNDIFEKYYCKIQLEGELIICNNSQNIKNSIKQKSIIVRETYEEYIEKISILDKDKDKDTWIYNILDDISEQECILYKDTFCLIIPSYTWINKDNNKLHILCMPFDKSIRCIRSLEEKHIDLLKYMKNKTIKIIEEVYHINETELKIFLHYEPSTYHLHIHFININHKECDSSVEYCHNIDDIIYNLSIKSDYYQKRILQKRVL
jgi:m7GpppX diphosphatase